MEYAHQLATPARPQNRPWHSGPVEILKSIPQAALTLFNYVKTIGVTAGMGSYDKSKLCIFNLLNFFQFITGIIVPVVGLLYATKIPVGAWMMASLPAM